MMKSSWSSSTKTSRLDFLAGFAVVVGFTVVVGSATVGPVVGAHLAKV
jgi:hypothetical protein